MVSRFEPCPRCRANGKDNSGDNLAVYFDGHKWCFSCGYREEASLESKMETLRLPNIPDTARRLAFPDDFSLLIPIGPYKWLKSFGLTEPEITGNSMGWSHSKQLLLFPVFGADKSDMIFWQGRSFASVYDEPFFVDGKRVGFTQSKKPKPKYLTGGNSSDILHVIGSDNTSTIILTEDLISAIKVGRVYQAMPLWGSSLSTRTMEHLRKYCISNQIGRVGIWLDPDKNKESVKMALRLSQYHPAVFCVQSAMDPKEYSTDAILQLVEGAVGDIINDLDPDIPTLEVIAT